MMYCPKALVDVSNERYRQITQEGWTPEHDDQHTDGSMADAAACYAATDRAFRGEEVDSDEGSYTVYGPLWPESWSDSWLKKTRRRRDLVKAGALIIAEIERLDRIGEVNSGRR